MAEICQIILCETARFYFIFCSVTVFYDTANFMNFVNDSPSTRGESLKPEDFLS